MTPEQFIKKQEAGITKAISFYCERYEISDKSQLYEDIVTDIFGDVFLWAAGRDDLDTFNRKYGFTMAKTLLIKQWRSRSVIKFAPGTEVEISSISEFSEECLANNADSAICIDRGGCTRFTVNPVYGPFPGYEDLEFDDQTALAEFCNPRAVNNTRRGTPRRLVDSILRKVDIDSGGVHDYSTRRRS